MCMAYVWGWPLAVQINHRATHADVTESMMVNGVGVVVASPCISGTSCRVRIRKPIGYQHPLVSFLCGCALIGRSRPCSTALGNLPQSTKSGELTHARHLLRCMSPLL